MQLKGSKRSMAIVPLLSLILVTACVSPAAKFDERAVSMGFRLERIAGAGFSHAIYHKPGSSPTLHVYLGGDGTVYRGISPTLDPTQRNPLILELMSLDPGQAVYLGRPCYHLKKQPPECLTKFWSTARYSETVILSMIRALRSLLATTEYGRISLFGYSGGGAIAVLIANRMEEVYSIVTIAANLDTARWSAYHGYPALIHSLNPAMELPLRRELLQRHFAGSEDNVVPSEFISDALGDSGKSVEIIDSYNHVCCWKAIWRKVMSFH